MSIKKMFGAALLAGATLTGTNAGATNPKSEKLTHRFSDDINACMNDEKKIATASEGVIGCRNKDGEVYYFSDDKKKKEETVVNSTETELEPQVISPKPTEKKKEDNIVFTGTNVNASINNVNISLGGVTTKLGTNAGRGTIEWGNSAFALGAEGIWSKDFNSAFAAMGFEIVKNTNGLITISAASQDLGKTLNNPDYSGKKAAAFSASFGVHWKNGFIEYLNEKGRSTELNTAIKTTYVVSEKDFITYLQKSTIKTETTTTTIWDALSRETITMGMRNNIASRFQSTLAAGLTRDMTGESRGVANANMTYYAGKWKAHLGVNHIKDNGNRISAGIVNQIDKNWSTITDIYHTSPSNGKSNTEGRIALSYTFGGGSTSPHNRPSTNTALSATQLVNGALSNYRLHVDPRELGELKTTSTSKVTEDIIKTAVAAQTISAESINMSIDPDTGNITVSMPVRAGWKYQYQIDNGTWVDISTPAVSSSLQSPPSLYSTLKSSAPVAVGSNNSMVTFTIPKLPTGKHILGFQEVNTFNGTNGAPTSKTVIISADSPATVTKNIVSATHNTATIKASISDLNGIKNYTCQVYDIGGTPIGSPVTAVNGICTISGLSELTQYEIVERALVGTLKYNGTIEYVPAKEVRTQFKTLEKPNTAPVANPDSVTVISGQSVKINPLANDKDADGNTLKIDTFSQGKNGKVTKNDDDSLTYTPNSGYIGTDEFTYTANDGKVNSTPTKVTIEVQPVPNTAPTAIGLSLDNNPLIAGSLTSGQTIGTLSCTDLESGNNCFYTTSDPRFSIIGNQVLLAQSGINLSAGTYDISVTARDRDGASMTSVVSIDITEVLDTMKPTITLNGPASMNINQGGTYTEPGATCTDNKDATCNVVITGSVNTAVAADYTLTYTATDLAGNVSIKTRLVKVNPVAVVVDTPAQVTLPSTTITKTSISFSGGSVLDIDAAGGFNYGIQYIVKDMSGNIVPRTVLIPGTTYQYIMQYNAWNKVTNSMITGLETSPQSFITQADEPTFCELHPEHPNCQ